MSSLTSTSSVGSGSATLQFKDSLNTKEKRPEFFNWLLSGSAEGGMCERLEKYDDFEFILSRFCVWCVIYLM